MPREELVAVASLSVERTIRSTMSANQTSLGCAPDGDSGGGQPGQDGEMATHDELTYLCSEPGCCQNCRQADNRVANQHYLPPGCR